MGLIFFLSVSSTLYHFYLILKLPIQRLPEKSSDGEYVIYLFIFFFGGGGGEIEQKCLVPLLQAIIQFQFYQFSPVKI